MDIASLIGLVGGVIVIIFGIVTGELGAAALGNFGDIPSVFITIGGSFLSLLTSYTLKEYVNNIKGATMALKVQNLNEGAAIKSIIELSNVARKEGLLALEEAANNLEDPFMKKGILLIVDGTDPDLVRGIMETELSCVEDRHKRVIGFWDNVASMGPAWGMIGTLIGLVNMLKNLDDASSIGPNMAVALLTTLYGSIMANWLATPISNKLKLNNSTEVILKEVMIEGLLSIQAGENPRVIEEKLKSFLSPKDRLSLTPDDGEQDGGGE